MEARRNEKKSGRERKGAGRLNHLKCPEIRNRVKVGNANSQHK